VTIPKLNYDTFKVMAKHKKISYTTLLLSIILLLVVGGVGFASLPIIKNTEIYKNYDANREITFISDRGKFSFKHPNWWPVIAAKHEGIEEKYTHQDLDGLGEYTSIEYVAFADELPKQAGDPTLGSITVERWGYKNLSEYVNAINKEKTQELFVKGRTQKVTFPAPKIRYIKIGGEDAISINESDKFVLFGSYTADYRLIRNGLMYKFVLGGYGYPEFDDKKSEVFQQIISSVKFLD
jgi:hypothetical protein